MKKITTILLLSFLFLLIPFNNIFAYNPTTTKNNIHGISIVNHTDLEDASKLVNSSGGDWGYVTIVITEDNRNKEIWQSFLDECRKFHLIPIIRVASKFNDGNWEVPNTNEIDKWVNFFQLIKLGN